MTVESRPLLGNDYLDHLYEGQSTLSAAVKGYLRRLADLAGSRNCAVIWIEKEALPWLPWLIERALIPSGVGLAVDYDDAVFHRYDQHPSVAVRRVLGRKLDRLMAASDIVTAGNSYLAERALAAGAPRVEIVPTVVDLAHYPSSVVSDSGSSPTIGWIGTPSTWSEYMTSMMPVLTEIARVHDARVRVVGAGHAAAMHPLLDSLRWTEETEVSLIQSMSVGIMPLTDTPWSRGKCGYKLLQYMACGLPVVASPVGVNADIVEHGVNGFLATTEAEWREALTTLLRDPALRHRMGQEGRRKVERDYSLQVWGPRVADLLRDVAERGR